MVARGEEEGEADGVSGRRRGRPVAAREVEVGGGSGRGDGES